MAKEPSERRLAAQRSNGGKSRGPRTPEGQANAKYNRLTHGLTAASVVITAGRGKEDAAAFETHKEYILNHYAPVGFQEEHYVEEIIRLTWRLRRADRYENGCIRSRVRAARKDEVEIEASMLPEAEPLQLTLRYQTTIGRRLDKLFAALERLQRRRKKAARRREKPEREKAAAKSTRPGTGQVISLKPNDGTTPSAGQSG